MSTSTAPERVSWTVLFSSLALFTIVGNFLSIAVFLNNSRLRRMRTSLLLINLAIADLLVGSVAVPMYMVFQWPESAIARDFTFITSYDAIDLLTGFASIFSLSAIGLERMFSVFSPHRHRATGKVPYYAAVMVCWLLSSLQVLLRILKAHKIVELTVFFYNMMFALSFAFVVMLVTYTAVWYKVRARQLELSDRGRSSRLSVERERRLILTLAIVTGFFLVTWLPFHLLNISLFFCVQCRQQTAINFVHAIKLLHYSNSFVNLIIYSCRFPDFRRTLCQFFGKTRRVDPDTQSNALGHMSFLNTNNRSPPVEMDEGIPISSYSARIQSSEHC